MATRFEISFPSIRNAEFSVYIDDADYVGTAVEVDAASDGFTTDYDGSNTDILDPIKGSRTTFTIAVSEDNQSELEDFAADLLSSAEGRFTMRIDHNTGFASDTLWWCGYVLADLSGFEDKYPPFGFRVVATDGLGRLKGIDYNDGATPPEPLGNLSFLDHIKNCLTSDGLADLYFSGSDIFIRTVVNWVDNTIGAPTAAKCPLKYSRGAGSVFAKRENNDGDVEWKFDSCYDVLEKILRDWQARIYFSDGCYRVEQIAERSLDSFFERRFDKTGTYLSSTTVVNYDKPVAQTLTESRLSGGVFNYLPALKDVEVTYEHRTASNQLTGTGGKWNIDSAAGDTVTITDVTTDADTIFRIQGRIYVKGSLDLSYVAPWRYVFKLKVAKGGEYLTSPTASQQSNGTYLPVVVRTPYTWESSLDYYEISSEFTFSSTIDEYIPFAFDVEGMPTGGGSIDIQFTVEDARRVDGGPIAVTLTDWRVLNPAFIIINSSDANSVIEVDREYSATNPDTGNSLTLEAKNTFGYAVRGWTETKIQTTSDLSTWTDSGVLWDQGTETTNGQFGELWAREAIALMRTPTGTYSGAFHTQNIFPHHRIILPDDTAYLFMRLTFESRELTYRGEWMRAGANRTSVTSGPTKKLGNKFLVDPSSTPSYPTGGNPGAGTGGIQASGDIAFAALAANYTGSTIAAGTITSIPLDLAVAENAFLDGDDVIVYNPTTRGVFTFTVATSSVNGDTSLAVDSVAITEDIPAGCYVLYSFLNRATTTGGGGPSLPAAVNGAILRGASGVWAAYSGSTNGNVLRWNDGTSTWEEQAPEVSGHVIEDNGSPMTQRPTLNFLTSGQIVIVFNDDFIFDKTEISFEVLADSITPTELQDTAVTPGSYTSTNLTVDAQGRITAASSGSGGVPAGTDTQTIRYSGTTATANSALTNDGTYLGVGGAPSTSYMVRVKQNASTKGLFVERNSSAVGAHIYHNGSATFESVGGNNLLLKSASGSLIYLQPGGGGGQSRQILITPGSNVTANLGNTAIVDLTGTYAPTAAGGDFSMFRLGSTINQTASADQITRGLLINPTLTAVVAAGFRAIEYPGTAQAFLWQGGGTGVKSHIQGSIGVGTGTTTPGAKIDLTGDGATSSTYGARFYNSTPEIILAIRDDKRLGVLTTSPAVTLDAIAATDSIGLPTGTTAQRPAVNSSARINSTVAGLEVRVGGAWQRLTCQVQPTIAAGAAAGTGPTVAINSGNDLCHEVSVLTGTSTTTGVLCTVTFNQALDAGLFTFVVFSPRNTATAAEVTKFYVGSAGNSSYTISCGTAPTASTTYLFHVMVKQ